MRIVCAHDGYAHLRGRPIHERTWTFGRGGLTVADSIGDSRLPATARFHLAPGMAIRGDSPLWIVSRGGTTVARVNVAAGRSRIEPSTHAPAFGVVQETQCLAVDLSAGRAVTEWSWAG